VSSLDEFFLVFEVGDWILNLVDVFFEELWALEILVLLLIFRDTFVGIGSIVIFRRLFLDFGWLWVFFDEVLRTILLAFGVFVAGLSWVTLVILYE
jgi:hypothetical protein